jgi:hypothetical protein
VDDGRAEDQLPAAAWPGTTIRAEGRVVHAGRTLALTECDVTDGEGRLLARASSTVMRLDRARTDTSRSQTRETEV